MRIALSKLKRTFISLFLAASFGSQAGASVYVSNLGESGTGGTTVTNPLATSFTTGSGPGWNLSSITVRLIDGSSTSRATTVSLYDEQSGLPGSVIASATQSIVTDGNGQDFAFNLPGTITLAPSTTYFVATTESSGDIFWGKEGFTGEDSNVGWTIADQTFAENPANTWTLIDQGSPSAHKFRVDAVAIPEPGSAFLLALAGIGFMARRRS